jgi:hypothetical protein
MATEQKENAAARAFHRLSNFASFVHSTTKPLDAALRRGCMLHSYRRSVPSRELGRGANSDQGLSCNARGWFAR